MGEKRFQALRKTVLFRVAIYVYAKLNSEDLYTLAKFFNTDKEGSHSYTKHYQDHFASLRSHRLNILEIGIGGHKNPQAGGASLRMWKYYFPRSSIFGIDVYEKHHINERRIKVFIGDQGDTKFLDQVMQAIGRINIVIDDGSHRCDDIITSFTTLFPHLEPGGVYVVEDTQTSYMPKFGGDPINFNLPTTTMGYFKGLADDLQRENPLRIASLHFYYNMIIIHKLEHATS